jgi:hypothetical protein
MSETPIKAEHQSQAQQFEHIGTWLQTERRRLEAELAYVRAREAQLSRDVQAFLLQHYGITPGQTVTLDTSRGVIITGGDSHDQP